MKIDYVLENRPDFDFGVFTKHLNNEIFSGTLGVSREKWSEYLEARRVYEILHTELINSLPKKVRRKFNAAHKNIGPKDAV